MRIAWNGQLFAHRAADARPVVDAYRARIKYGQSPRRAADMHTDRRSAYKRWHHDVIGVGPWRINRGLLSCVAAHARTQSSQRVQRSRLTSIVSVPLRSDDRRRKSSKLESSRPRCRSVLLRGRGGDAGLRVEFASQAFDRK